MTSVAAYFAPQAGWDEEMTLTGEIYYVNRVTKETSWDKPMIPPASHASTALQTMPFVPPPFAEVSPMPTPTQLPPMSRECGHLSKGK